MRLIRWVLEHLLATAGALALVVLIVLYVLLQVSRARERKAAAALLEATARELGGVVADNVSKAALIRQMTEEQKIFAAALAKKGGRPDSVTKTVVEFRDRIPVTEATPGTWTDPHNRFSLNLSAGVLDRHQKFTFSAVVVRSADGKSRVMKQDFQELDPVSGAPITDEAKPELSTSFSFVEEAAEASRRPYWGAWPVAGIDFAGRPIAGARVLDLERTGRPILKDLGLGVLAGYDAKDSSGIFAGFLGYRILGSNIELVGYYGLTTRGAAVGSVGVVFEIAR